MTAEQRILEHVRVADVLDLLGYPWELVADHTQQIHCPIHDDQTPSARYYHEQQKVYCFTCGASWDVVGLVAVKRGISRAAAVQALSEEFPTAESAETLTQRLRAQLRTPGGPDYTALLADAERRLIARRRQLGLDGYSRRLLALDMVRFRVANGEAQDVPGLVRRVLADT